MNFNACLSMMLSLLSQLGYIKTPPPPPKPQCFKVSKDHDMAITGIVLKRLSLQKGKTILLR